MHPEKGSETGHPVFFPAQADTGSVLAARAREELIPDGELVTDGHGLIQEASRGAAALLRCPHPFLPGKPLGLFLAEGHRSRFYESLARLWQGMAADRFETRIGRQDQSLRDVVVSVWATPADARVPGNTELRWLFEDITERKRAAALQAELLRKRVSAQEEERQRVARDLHDSVGQLLTALMLAVKATRDAASLPPGTDARLAEVERVASELSRVVHDLAVRLRPTVLDDIGLEAALSQYVAEWAARTRVEVDYVAPEARRFPPSIETALYRVVQEAMTNVARHAQARRVSVVLSCHAGVATVAVEDDGIGFDPESAGKDRLGLVGMRERAALAGGTLDIESSPGAGTTVIARIPLGG